MNSRGQFLVNQEAERIRRTPFNVDNRATIKIARRVMLLGSLMWNGVLYDPRSKHLGVGVYQITFVKKEYQT